MARRKIDARRLGEEEDKVVLLLGALEEIRREAEQLRGGAVARIRQTCDRHLGPSTHPPRKSL